MMKFKKIFLSIFYLGIIIPGMFAAEKWLDKDAEYRISFTLPRKGAPGFWKVDNYAFPFDLKDGFTVWDEAGKKYKFFFDLRKRQLIFSAAKKDNAKIYIYPSRQALEKILKKRQYYVPGRYIRDWNWWKDQAGSQAVNIAILSYEPDPKAKEKAKARAKVVAKAKAKAEARAKKARAIAKAKADAKAKVLAKAKAIADAKIFAREKAAAIAKVEAEIIAEANNKADRKTSIKKVVKKRIVKKKAVKKIVRQKLKKKPKKKKRKARPKRLLRIGHLPANDFPDDSADLKKIFKYKRQQYIYRRNYRDTNFIRSIYRRIKGKYVAYVDIKLNVPQAGKYQFAVKTNDMVQLYVNGEKALSINKKTASTSKWLETKLFDLAVNPVNIEAYYRSTVDKTSLVIGWRAQGEKAYKFISQKDYVDFNKVEPASLSGKKGQNLPVIKYNMPGYFQNNDGKQFLLGFETNFPSNKIAWQVNGRNLDKGNEIMMTFANKIPGNISCIVNDSKPFKVIIPQLDLKNKGVLLKRDLYIKINAPTFIYDDETLDFSAEFHSELQIDIKAFLEAKSNSNIFEKFKFSHAFNKTSNEALFRTHDFVKKYFKLEGAKLKSGTELEFSIKTSADNVKPGKENFYFDHKKIVFKKLSECSELKTENGYFVDSKGNRIIPILHRPTLNDKRSWSLLNSLPGILGGQSILIISDDFGYKSKFSAELVKNAESNGQKLFFEDWNLKAFNADIINESARKINLIKKSKAAVLIIIPSTYPIMRGISPRLQQRLLAALIQTARDNRNIKKIILTTPFPLTKVFAGNETLEIILKNIQQLVIEQEIAFMSLPEIPADEETILSNTHPAGKTKEYADIVVKQK